MHHALFHSRHVVNRNFEVFRPFPVMVWTKSRVSPKSQVSGVDRRQVMIYLINTAPTSAYDACNYVFKGRWLSKGPACASNLTTPTPYPPVRKIGGHEISQSVAAVYMNNIWRSNRCVIAVRVNNSTIRPCALINWSVMEVMTVLAYVSITVISTGGQVLTV